MNYTLKVKFTPKDLENLQITQMRLILAKPIDSAQNPSVAWLVIDPFEKNTIQWTEQYGLYAATPVTMINGATINRVSEVETAYDGMVYNFNNSNTFDEPGEGGSEGSFNFTNGSKKYPNLNFGLMQSANVNNKAVEMTPINTVYVPDNMPVVMTPLTTVHVWMQAFSASGTVITQITGKVKICTFGDQVTSLSLKYEKGTFIPDGSNTLSIKDAQLVGVY